MDERRGFQCLPGCLVRHARLGEFAQFVIDQWQQLRRRMRIPAADGGELRLTHELMSECLGVRRESISMVAHRLHQERVISYTRGRIALVDRAALEARSCECYAVVKNDLTAMFDQGLGASGVRHPAQTRGRHAPRTHVAAC